MSLNLDRWLNWLESVELFGEKKKKLLPHIQQMDR